MIYIAKNLINGKVYIGKTEKTLEKRKHKHETVKDNLYFHQALRKHGKENFEWSILDADDSKESYYIELYNSNDRNKGYNCTKGGDGGDTWSKGPNREEILKKKSDAMKKCWQDPNYIENIMKERLKLKDNKEFIEKVRNNTVNMWKDKKIQDSISNKLKNCWQDEEYRTSILINRAKSRGIKSFLLMKFKIIDNFTNEHIVDNLRSFCKENNINFKTIIKYVNKGKITKQLHSGRHIKRLFGWEIIIIEDKNL